MKHFGIKLIAACLLVIGFFVILGIAGDIDYCEQIILHMSQEEYDSIKKLLSENGHHPSERDIAHWWAEHHE